MVRRTAGGAATVPSVAIVSSIAYLGIVILSINCRKSQQRKERYYNLLCDVHCLLFAARQLSAPANRWGKRRSREREECGEVLWLELTDERQWSAIHTLGLAMLARQRYKMPFALYSI